MNELIKTAETELRDAILAIQQPRTDFQLAHFVVGQHDCEPRRWLQCVLELQIKISNLKRAEVEERRTRRKIAALRELGTDDANDEAELLEIDLEQHSLAIVGAVRETQTLLAIFRGFGRNYTNEELNAAESEYWQARLTRQAKHALISTGRIGIGDLDALEQIGQPVGPELVQKLERELCQKSNPTYSAGGSPRIATAEKLTFQPPPTPPA